MKLPSDPCQETSRIFAHDKLTRLVKAEKEYQINLCYALGNEHGDRKTHIRSARAKDIGMKKCIAGILLVWKTFWLKMQ